MGIFMIHFHIHAHMYIHTYITLPKVFTIHFTLFVDHTILDVQWNSKEYLPALYVLIERMKKRQAIRRESGLYSVPGRAYRTFMKNSVDQKA